MENLACQEHFMLECASDGIFADGELDLVSMLGLPQSSLSPQGFDDLLLSAPIKTEEGLKTEFLSDSDTGSRMQGDFPSSTGQGNVDASDGAGDDAYGKRRRRIRNAKQQELNRLAQQRYRQRKKQKYGDLQAAVDDLSAKMEIIARLEDEAEILKKNNADAQSKIQQQQKLIDEQKRRLDTLPAVMMRAAAAAAAAAASKLPRPLIPVSAASSGSSNTQPAAAPAVATGPAIPLSQNPQACALSMIRRSSIDGTNSASSNLNHTHQQQGAVCDRLISALRSALSEVCAEQGWHESSKAQEQVISRFGKSLHKELMTVAPTQVPASATGATSTALINGAGLPQPSSNVPVTCC
ncbi:hypothetical protein CEUSTIGMA_g2485.t1 [Chlamydomonas eustigma]|uniref:BZIP domain-containing protein n=1 Tax=Chlamydomonas eustigma TaxID=1157962 RepID=A0A250WW49_9CHLO|nr:hypothetical protein CEUSTIGMA_g2485.t1 [Chlamydomonas eustigma]|eukprot:GAX75041.1 hypothetical protein CEUSTIGMA_g2485.t1 [Chlamydomonas eustigma]